MEIDYVKFEVKTTSGSCKGISSRKLENILRGSEPKIGFPFSHHEEGSTPY